MESEAIEKDMTAVSREPYDSQCDEAPGPRSQQPEHEYRTNLVLSLLFTMVDPEPASFSPDNLEDVLSRLTKQQLYLGESVNAMTLKIDELIQRVSPVFSTTPPTPPPLPAPAPTPIHRLKLDVPRFDGSDPLGWIYKITQFFEYHGTPDSDKLTIASFYMEGRTLAWFQWMNTSEQFPSWPAFLHALRTRFAPSQFEDPSGALSKLTQTGTVTQYLSDFEDLANRTTGLPSTFLLSCFISGLIPEIRREVQAHQPATLVQAAGLARLQEEKFSEMRQHPRPRPSPLPQFQRSPSVFPSFPQVNTTAPVSSPPLSPILKTPSSPLSSTLPPLLPPPPPRPPPQTWKRLSPEEIASRRERGLCFNCEEKFHRGHRCSSRFFLLITDEEDPPLSHIPNFDPPITLTHDPVPIQPTDPPESPPSYSAQISLNSLAGHVAPETIRFIGAISGHPLLLLVDGGSTHNFVQQQLVTQLGLSCRTTSPLRVMVGNGQYLECHSICDTIFVQIQNHSFTVDLHVLPISGANVVLGVQWLKSLGPVLTDYSTLSMQFIHNDQLITLQGDPEASLSSMTSSQFRRLCRTQPQGLYFQITVLSDDTPPSSPDTLPPSLQALLTKYDVLFQPSPTLPPPRPTDHHIHLLPLSTPVNVRPYCYPHFQKQEIELQVDSMLQKGLIQPSTSPFSSPVLLVKKHDGSWRFCVDYRALNSLTVKDRFLIPTIDELLDELGGAQCFSKLDLLQGYHQIRMHSEDIPKTAFRTHHGHYEFRVMPFGLCNAPSSFQATMNLIFRPFLRRFVIVFFDDILIYSSSFDDHLHHLDLTFQVLLDNHFVLKKSKCSFGQSQVEYLGHLVSQRGVEPMPDKIAAIVNWPQPHSTRAVRSFLGLAGFYRRFIRGYAMIADPLVKATSDPFRWTPQAQQAFEDLKSALSTAPVLALPDFQEPFTVETDASGNGMGAVLSQRGHPIAYFSKPFPKKLLRASTYVRELFAITSAVKKWRQYLLGHSFTIVTDHRSLKELLTQVIQTPEQHMYLA
ncbi:uncharacterized protein LOC114416364 [Glycine soja]|uniref:uncharacterized protein LOC114416364 n=1 Tax=Glycine soja TaxID=3848 RepID=UPI00103A6C7A|nr:uncharacterized protein LOC114416364 [Glycine soja]